MRIRTRLGGWSHPILFMQPRQPAGDERQTVIPGPAERSHSARFGRWGGRGPACRLAFAWSQEGTTTLRDIPSKW
jgi:hypothetical protein